ncbi:DUF4440 domain-containing protein [Pseudonocardia sp. MH-G8]|uniref:DUF4440 domain-containing protein n=1 Tax=Pseudonocardia sp. MH-G8 TaxID=1854588 RepID=UPI000BA0D6FE|nr:DUF4440 domain-containing protein [Pseudonocardia sp. MH-G8]OZM82466.1 DUF4440 domain-containing protein [Pseudonocardia sp. MH-G8]
MDESVDTLRDRCAAQVGDLHRTIEDWLTGRVQRTPASFAVFADAHAPDFTMVTPDGVLMHRDELLAGFEGAHGGAPGLSIRIADVTVVHATADIDTGGVLVTYEEHQDGPAGRSVRRSTVLLVRDAAAPHGLRSRHLHETWVSRER